MVSFNESSIVVRESSSDPVLLCIQIRPTEQIGIVSDEEEQRLEIMSIQGSADGMEKFMRTQYIQLDMHIDSTPSV